MEGYRREEKKKRKRKVITDNDKNSGDENLLKAQGI